MTSLRFLKKDPPLHLQVCLRHYSTSPARVIFLLSQTKQDLKNLNTMHSWSNSGSTITWTIIPLRQEEKNNMLHITKYTIPNCTLSSKSNSLLTNHLKLISLINTS